MFAVLFDLEGTLVQTDRAFWETSTVQEFRRLTRKKLIELGIPPEVLKKTRSYSLMRNKAVEYVQANFSEEETRLFHQKFDEFLEYYEMGSAKGSTLFPDTIPTLRRLKELDYKLGLVTNTSKKATQYMFTMHGLEKYFDTVVTREDVKKFKPEPEGILLALKKLDEREFVLIGDIVYDASAAERAGGISIVAKRDPSKELDFHADYTIQSLEEILGILQTISEAKQEY